MLTDVYTEDRARYVGHHLTDVPAGDSDGEDGPIVTLVAARLNE